MKKLEDSKLFPYIAWTTVIGFALFTYNLALDVQDQLEDIDDGIESLDMRLDRIEQKVNTSGTPTAAQ